MGLEDRFAVHGDFRFFLLFVLFGGSARPSVCPDGFHVLDEKHFQGYYKLFGLLAVEKINDPFFKKS